MAALLVLATPAPSVAEDKRAETAQKETTAEQLAEQGYTAYEAGRFTDAVGLYMRAFQTSGDARLLYNVASIYDKKLHDRALAEDFYRRYLRSTTTEPSLVKKANERLVEMKNELDTLADNGHPPPVKPASTPPPPPPAPAYAYASGSTLRTVGYVTGAAGIVLLGVGTAFGLSAKSKADDVNDDCPNDRCRSAASVNQRDDAATAATLSTIFFGAGLAALASGVVMVLVAPKSTSRSAAGPKLRITAASFAGTF